MNQRSEAVVLSNPSQMPSGNVSLQQEIETLTQILGQQIFEASKLSFLGNFWQKDFWVSKVMALATQDPRVKTQLFRFVDVLPVLQTPEQKELHLLEYLGEPAEYRGRWPWSLRAITSTLKIPILKTFVVGFSNIQVRQMADHFIVGQNLDEALVKILKRRERKLAFTLDILGEAVVSESEANAYFKKYVDLIEGLGRQNWKKVSPIDDSSLGPIPAVNISIKISSLDCRMDPMAYESSLERLESRLEILLRSAIKYGIFINFDMEQFALKDLTQELFKRLILRPEFRSYRHFGIVVQAYLRSSKADVESWIEIARQRGSPFTIRLVKGAYWDYEKIVADQNSWEIPVYLQKSDSDANYEECTRLLLGAFPAIEVAIGSHNIRSISHAIACAEVMKLPPHSFEVQMLYGMAEPFKEALVKRGIRLREYDPIGEMLPGLSYLVRRLLENTSNDSFLKQSFVDKTGVHDLLRAP